MKVEYGFPLYIVIALCIWLLGCVLGRKYGEEEWHIKGLIVGFFWPGILILVASLLPVIFIDWASKVNILGKNKSTNIPSGD